MIILIFSFSNNINPMKVCWKLLVSVVLISIIIWINLSQSWGSIIFLILFIGGILIIFIIVSSLLPSDLMKIINFSKIKILLVFLFMFYYYNVEIFSVIDTQCIEIKELISDINILIFMIIIMVSYFFCISIMLIKEFTSIRYHF